MLYVGAGVSVVVALVAGVLGFTGVVKGVAGAAKALFFGAIAVAGVLAALALFVTEKVNN